jgi:[protein-PII] uridylyltransferase
LIRTHREKVLEHGERRLGCVARLTEPEEISSRLRSFLKIEDRRLRIAHRLGAGGMWTARARSFVIDTLVAHAFRIAAAPARAVTDETARAAGLDCALIAVGGYGRAELSPFSDIDLLFLHADRRSSRSREMTERVLHLLWDAGLDIGHRSHTVDECIAAARNDPHFQTALACVRPLAGDRAFPDKLRAALERERRKHGAAWIAMARRQRDERHLKTDRAIYLQEPNVKESAGGLRDLHTALWALSARHGCGTLEDVRLRRGIISEDEYAQAHEAYSFLLRVRHEAHWLTGRKTDRLALDLQGALAEEFGYVSSPYLLASEQFMRDYYRRARAVFSLSETMLARVEEEASSPSPDAPRWFNRLRRAQAGELFSIRDGQLRFERDARLFAERPQLFFEAFALAQVAGVTLGHDLREAMRRHLSALDHRFRASDESAHAFLKLLGVRGRVAHVLRLMHEVGFLGRYIPEFGRITMLIQHDLYHHYTVDEHTLRAVEALDRLPRTGEQSPQERSGAQLSTAFDEVKDASLLYLSVLLHDLGKGRGRGHIARGAHIARRVCARLQMGAKDAGLVMLLVRHHVLMAHLSQRRDVREPRLAKKFAADMGSVDALNMLLLLTYADLNGVGPGVWSTWKGTLLLELYHRTRAHLLLAPGSDAPFYAAEAAARLKEEVFSISGGKLARSEIERHFALLPRRYARSSAAAQVASDLLLIEGLRDSGGVIGFRWLPPTGAATELTIAARDRRGLFADLAGALAAQGIEILSADLNTRGDQIALDHFALRDAATRRAIEEHRLPSLERALLAAARGAGDVAAAVERWRTHHAPRRLKSSRAVRRTEPTVACDNEIAEAATVVEVRAADEHGLAYKIASILTACGLDIDCAKIATEKSDALDVFYVTNAGGAKLTAAQIAGLTSALKSSLAGALSEGWQPSTTAVRAKREVIAG